MAGPANAHPDWEPLPWDSACFGFATARLRAGLDPEGLRKAVAASRAAGMELAYWTTLPEDKAGCAAATALGGTRVDERLTYVLEPVPAGETGMGRMAEARGRGWDAALEEMAPLAGMYSRFRVDPRFPRDRFQALYREWMRKSLSGERADAVLAVPGENGPEGFVTLAAREREGSIGLIAVATGRQGKGLGSELMRAASAWFRERNCVRASVVTQAANAAACALYERDGYRVARREIVFHFWR
jgi:dTDP-4-amino-4,6-dideoxy-D-galactose acyltransferase